MVATREHEAVELSSRAFRSATADEREERFAVLRAQRPVSWHRPVQDALLPDITADTPTDVPTNSVHAVRERPCRW